MKVNTRSWHYSIAEIVFDYPSHSLCVYFWQVVWAMLLVPALCIILAAAIATIVVLLVLPIWQWWAGDVRSLQIFSAMCWIALGLITRSIALESAGRKFNTPWWATALTKRKENTKPSLLAEYIRAKRDKICPRIDFTGD
jgi:hypothetical protein